MINFGFRILRLSKYLFTCIVFSVLCLNLFLYDLSTNNFALFTQMRLSNFIFYFNLFNYFTIYIYFCVCFLIYFYQTEYSFFIIYIFFFFRVLCIYHLNIWLSIIVDLLMEFQFVCNMLFPLTVVFRIWNNCYQ